MAVRVDAAGLSATACVRVRDRAGRVVGSGFLVGPDLAATCAHVVASALGSDPYGGSPPDGVLDVDFPVLPGSPAVRTARVHRWVPIDDEHGTGDIALLRLDSPAPPGAVMPPLRRVDRLWDAPFRVFGFPDGRWDGVWSTGRIRGGQGTGWFQLQVDPGDHAIESGFSGAPVWEDRAGAVAGIVVAADRDPDVTTAYLLPIEQVLGLDPEILPCPYRGLEPFGEEHAEYFFGRDAEIDRLTAAVRRHPLVAVAGPSGTGKSSLLRAGLVPRLRAAGARVAEVRPRPGVPALPDAIAAIRTLVAGADGTDGTDGAEPTSLAAELTDPATGEAVAAELASAFTGGTGAGERVLLVDQFEELAAADPGAARELLDALAAVALAAGPESALRVVLTARGIAVDDVLAPQVAERLGPASVFIGALDRARLREAIVRPADRAPGLAFEDGLVDRILDDAGAEPGQLSLVESLLAQLWARREGGSLTLAGYEAAGGVPGALAAHAEQVVATVVAQGWDIDRLRALCTRLAVTGRDGQFVRRVVGLDELPGELAELIPVLAASRLVVTTGPGGHTPAGSVELAHQALIEHWPRLHRWLEDDRDFLSWRSELDTARQRWEDQDRDEGALLRGGALETATNWTRRRPDELSAAQAGYVQRSSDRRRRDIRRWRMATAVLTVLVLVAGVLAVVSVQRGNALSEQLRVANAELVAQAALARSATDPVTATQLALAAWKLDPSKPSARQALLNQYATMRLVEAAFPAVNDQPIVGFGAAVDGTLLLQTTGGLALVAGLTGDAPQTWQVPGVPPDYVNAGVSPDGRWITAADPAGTVLVWDVRARSGPIRLAPSTGGPGADPRSIRFSPDSERLLWLTPPGPDGRTLEIWRLAERTPVEHELGGLTDPTVRAVRQSLDPDLVMLRFGDPENDPDSRLALRSLTDGTELRSFPPSAIATAGVVVHCAGTTDPDPIDIDSVVVAVRPDLGREIARFTVDEAGSACSAAALQQKLTVDGNHLLEVLPSVRPEPQNGRIISVRDGRAFQTVFPPNTLVEPVSGLAAGDTMSVVPTDSGRPVVLLTHHTSVLRLRAEATVLANGVAFPRLALSRNERALVGRSGNSFVAMDRDSRVETGRLPDESVRGERPSSLIHDGLTLLTVTDREWVVSRFALPGLTPGPEFTIAGGAVPPTPTGGSRPVVTVLHDRLYMLADGVLHVWETDSGDRVGEPVRLARNPQEQAWFDRFSVAQPRPGHPDEVAVLGPGNAIQRWNVVTGDLLSSLPAPEGRLVLPTTFAFSPDGSLIATLAEMGTLNIWNLERQELVTGPIPAPDTVEILGFTTDGQLVTLDNAGTQQVVFRNTESGATSGSLLLPLGYDIGSGLVDGSYIDFHGLHGVLPHHMPATARGWYDHLCGFSDRPFTSVEESLLPPGVQFANPCS